MWGVPPAVRASLLFAVGLGLGLLILYALRQVLLLFFLAWVVAAALRPAVETLAGRLPRGLAAALVYLGIIGPVLAIFALSLPVLGAELRLALGRLQAALSLWLTALDGWLTQFGVDLDPFLAGLPGALAAEVTPERLIGLPLGVFSGVLGVIALLAVAFYWLVERDALLARLVQRWPRATPGVLWLERAERRVGAYLRGQLVVSAILSLLVFLGLLALGVRPALALAALLFVLEIIPILGPLLASLPAILLGFAQGPVTGLLVIGLYLLVHQLEAYVLSPRIQALAVRLPPLVVLVAVLSGAELLGLFGALIAVPVAVVIATLLEGPPTAPETSKSLPSKF